MLCWSWGMIRLAGAHRRWWRVCKCQTPTRSPCTSTSNSRAAFFPRWARWHFFMAPWKNSTKPIVCRPRNRPSLHAFFGCLERRHHDHARDHRSPCCLCPKWLVKISLAPYFFHLPAVPPPPLEELHCLLAHTRVQRRQVRACAHPILACMIPCFGLCWCQRLMPVGSGKCLYFSLWQPWQFCLGSTGCCQPRCWASCSAPFIGTLAVEGALALGRVHEWLLASAAFWMSLRVESNLMRIYLANIAFASVAWSNISISLAWFSSIFLILPPFTAGSKTVAYLPLEQCLEWILVVLPHPCHRKCSHTLPLLVRAGTTRRPSRTLSAHLLSPQCSSAPPTRPLCSRLWTLNAPSSTGLQRAKWALSLSDSSGKWFYVNSWFSCLPQVQSGNFCLVCLRSFTA